MSLRSQASPRSVTFCRGKHQTTQVSRSGVWAQSRPGRRPSTTYTDQTALHGLQTCPPRQPPPPTLPAPPGAWLPKDHQGQAEHYLGPRAPPSSVQGWHSEGELATEQAPRASWEGCGAGLWEGCPAPHTAPRSTPPNPRPQRETASWPPCASVCREHAGHGAGRGMRAQGVSGHAGVQGRGQRGGAGTSRPGVWTLTDRREPAVCDVRSACARACQRPLLCLQRGLHVH